MELVDSLGCFECSSLLAQKRQQLDGKNLEDQIAYPGQQILGDFYLTTVQQGGASRQPLAVLNAHPYWHRSDSDWMEKNLENQVAYPGQPILGNCY